MAKVHEANRFAVFIPSLEKDDAIMRRDLLANLPEVVQGRDLLLQVDELSVKIKHDLVPAARALMPIDLGSIE